MQNFGGAETFAPGEDGGSAGEALSEEARARFQGQAAAAAAVRKEETTAKKRDDGVAGAIMQFLTDAQRKHLATLIAAVVARDCPSPFLLALLSLINADCLARAEEYFREIPDTLPGDAPALPDIPGQEAAREAAAWTRRMQRVLQRDPAPVLAALRTPEGPLDASLLQLAAAIVQEFAGNHGSPIARPVAEQAAARALQAVFGKDVPA